MAQIDEKPPHQGPAVLAVDQAGVDTKSPTNGRATKGLTDQAQDAANPGLIGIGDNDVPEEAVEPSIDGNDTMESLDSGDEDVERQVMDYEEQRLQTIKDNAKLLASLGLDTMKTGPSSPKKPRNTTTTLRSRHKPIQTLEPTRRSGRIAAQEIVPASKPRYSEPLLSGLPDNWDDRKVGRKRMSDGPDLPRGKRIDVPSIQYEPGKRKRKTKEEEEEVEEDDFTIVHPKPTRAEDGTNRLRFTGRYMNIFEPNVTPEEVLKGGAFAGGYYKDDYSNVLKKDLPDSEELESLPASYTTPSGSFNPSTHLTASVPLAEVNRFKVFAGQGLREWEKSGWIWEGDPRGWMQWYVRFYEGRRCADDERQISRWLKLAGPTGRFSRALMKKIVNASGSGGGIETNSAVEDEDVGRVLRQVCWQWGWECNKAEWAERIREGRI